MKYSTIFILLFFVNLIAKTISDSLFVDLNSDGKKEKILCISEVDNEAEDIAYEITIFINDDEIYSVEDTPWIIKRSFVMIDLNTNDNFNEFYLQLDSPSGSFSNYYFFNYKVNSSSLIGQVSSTNNPEISGYGFFYTTIFRGFWFSKHKYFFQASNNAIEEIPQPFYFVGVTGNPKTYVPFYTDRSLSTMVGKLNINSKVEILLSDLVFYLVKSESGLVGWLSRKQIEKNFPNLPWAN